MLQGSWLLKNACAEKAKRDEKRNNWNASSTLLWPLEMDGHFLSFLRMVHPGAYRMSFPLKISIWWPLVIGRKDGSLVGQESKPWGENSGTRSDPWSLMPALHTSLPHGWGTQIHMASPSILIVSRRFTSSKAPALIYHACPKALFRLTWWHFCQVGFFHQIQWLGPGPCQAALVVIVRQPELQHKSWWRLETGAITWGTCGDPTNFLGPKLFGLFEEHGHGRRLSPGGLPSEDLAGSCGGAHSDEKMILYHVLSNVNPNRVVFACFCHHFSTWSIWSCPFLGEPFFFLRWLGHVVKKPWPQVLRLFVDVKTAGRKVKELYRQGERAVHEVMKSGEGREFGFLFTLSQRNMQKYLEISYWNNLKNIFLDRFLKIVIVFRCLVFGIVQSNSCRFPRLLGCFHLTSSGRWAAWSTLRQDDVRRSEWTIASEKNRLVSSKLTSNSFAPPFCEMEIFWKTYKEDIQRHHLGNTHKTEVKARHQKISCWNCQWLWCSSLNCDRSGCCPFLEDNSWRLIVRMLSKVQQITRQSMSAPQGMGNYAQNIQRLGRLGLSDDWRNSYSNFAHVYLLI